MARNIPQPPADISSSLGPVWALAWSPVSSPPSWMPVREELVPLSEAAARPPPHPTQLCFGTCALVSWSPPRHFVIQMSCTVHLWFGDAVTGELLQGKGCPQPRVTSLWVMPKRPTSGKQEEGPGGHPCSQGAGKPSCFIQRPGGGDGCGRRFPGAFYCAVFSTFTSRTSEAVSLGGSQSKQTVSWTQRICAKGLVWLLPTCAWTPCSEQR